jgi:hypothetical protein
MTIRGLLVRFSLIYAAALLLGSALLASMQAQSSSAANIAALAATVMWVCFSFGRKNGRYFTGAEKWQTWGGMVAINVCFQTALAWYALGGTGKAVSPSILLGVLGFVGLLHALAIYFFIGIAGKMLTQQGIGE